MGFQINRKRENIIRKLEHQVQNVRVTDDHLKLSQFGITGKYNVYLVEHLDKSQNKKGFDTAL